MKRVIEPELMSDKEQAIAYANANFEEPHNHFLELLRYSIEKKITFSGDVIDLGTGTADIAIRFAKTYPSFSIDAVDGSIAMLNEAKKAVNKANLRSRIKLIHSSIQDAALMEKEYAIVMSNSLLHHLHNPMVLWELVKKTKGTPIIFIMDLVRPKNKDEVEDLVDKYAREEPKILQRDFRNSLKAAFTTEEVLSQLRHAGLKSLKVSTVSDRHFVISNC
jgi:2-polyprenyl-3-methyl-5-hydroxy-6-metoxy-1,4-benzoquinol methylase